MREEVAHPGNGKLLCTEVDQTAGAGTTRMMLKSIVLCERSQVETLGCCKTPLVTECRETESQIGGGLGVGIGAACRWAQGTLSGDGSVLKPDCRGGVATVSITTCPVYT